MNDYMNSVMGYPTIGGGSGPLTGMQSAAPTQRELLKGLIKLHTERLSAAEVALKALDDNPGIEAAMQAIQKALYR